VTPTPTFLPPKPKAAVKKKKPVVPKRKTTPAPRGKPARKRG
jgi:hypothetical protein